MPFYLFIFVLVFAPLAYGTTGPIATMIVQASVLTGLLWVLMEAARERALRDLRIRVSILKSNKRSLKAQVENYQQQAANMERRGETVDVARLTAIENLQHEIEATDRAIVDRQQEIADVSAAYQKDIERFERLLEIVELRRSLLAQERAAREAEKADPRR